MQNNKRPLSSNNALAFTMVEMLAVVTIMVLLTTAVVTGWANFVQNNQAVTIGSQLTNAIRLARTSAIEAGSNVVLCAVNPPNGTTCTASTTWNAWMLFIDVNGTNVYSSGDTILKTYYNLPASAITGPSTGYISFTAAGFSTTTGSSQIFTIKPSGCVGNNGRIISIVPSGSIQTDFTTCP